MLKSFSFEKLVFFFIAFIVLLIGARVLYSESGLYIFLIWNIFLAWVPMFISRYLSKNKKAPKWKQILLLGSWLLFFPNALYIITDLIHLEIETIVPKWFDAILLFSSSIIGLVMAFASLYRVEKFLFSRYTERKVELMVIGFLFLGSFGVYLGRFLRWNSWDIIHRPIELSWSVLERFIFPWQHSKTWAITCILTVIFYLLYSFIKKMPGPLNRAI